MWYIRLASAADSCTVCKLQYAPLIRTVRRRLELTVKRRARLEVPRTLGALGAGRSASYCSQCRCRGRNKLSDWRSAWRIPTSRCCGNNTQLRPKQRVVLEYRKHSFGTVVFTAYLVWCTRYQYSWGIAITAATSMVSPANERQHRDT